MALRLKESCIGRNFRNTNCGGYGNACLACTGVRELDWDQRANHTPTTITWIDANCGTGPAPCGGGVHCEGSVYAESLWDYFTRDLPTHHGLRARTRRSRSRRARPTSRPVRSATCSSACRARAAARPSSAYPNFLAADDDNGNLADGTPHMAALFSAFNRHGIACATPAVAVSGCANAPATAPAVTVTAGDRGASLSWTTVPGAVRYRVYRTDGVFGCNFGKILLGETFGTTWSDNGLQNGRLYSYTVAAVGFSNTCLGPMSACAQVTPAAGAPTWPPT